jgi:germacradienol/geosmin synthase
MTSTGLVTATRDTFGPMNGLAFDLPFEPMRNHHVAAVRPQVWDWVAEFDLPAGPHAAHRMGLDLLAAHIYPSASPENLALLTKWVIWLFLLDDQFDDRAVDDVTLAPHYLLTEMRSILDDQQSGGESPLTASLADLWLATGKLQSPQWRAMFKAHMSGYLNSFLREMSDRVSGRHLSLPTYLSHRRDSVAVVTFLDLAEIAAGVELAEEIRMSPELAAVQRALSDHVGAVNDIFSHRKETAFGYYHNAVCIVCAEQGLSVPRAMEVVRDLADGFMREYVAAEQELLVPAAYRTEMRALLRGNVTWCRMTNRYAESAPIQRAKVMR